MLGGVARGGGAVSCSGNGRRGTVLACGCGLYVRECVCVCVHVCVCSDSHFSDSQSHYASRYSIHACICVRLIM